MNSQEFWKNFSLGTELQISGTFVHNGLRCFREMKNLDNTEEIFEVLYNLAVGLERLLKVAVVLLEHDPSKDQAAFEKTLITHTHQDLLRRIRKHVAVPFAGPHNELLALLGEFYKSYRYDRFTLSGGYDLDKEKVAFRGLLERQLGVVLEPTNSILPANNCERYRRWLQERVSKIATELYGVIRVRASSLNLYTYEIRPDSKAAKVFLRNEAPFAEEDILWRELLVYFMNTRDSAGVLKFLREIEPLEFDPGDAADFLLCFQSDVDDQLAMDQLNELYSNLDDIKRRLKRIRLIGNPNAVFDSSPECDENEDDNIFDDLPSDA